MTNTQWLYCCLPLLTVLAMRAAAQETGQARPAQRMIGMYVHQHWPYYRPYCARTWTLEDWRGYADGLKRLGYNAFLIWPMLETMPDPPTPSDRAALEKMRRVVDMLHDEFGMKVWITLCPNIVPDDAVASKATFLKRHYYYCDRMINPADPAAMRDLLRRREKLLRPLAKVDGVAIIDSDPGGYPGSTNQDFVNLLGEHRRLFDRLRPGIELVYWMHAGWRGWSRLYETGKFALGTPEEHEDTVKRLATLDPEPWGMANGLDYARKHGIEQKVISFNYGRIEGEPSFPLTNFGDTSAHEGARSDAPRGVMGNAQTHCVQLPNTFAFARGAQGLPLTDSDYVRCANDLISGQGALIVEGWQRLSAREPQAMLETAARLERASRERLAAGPLKGLLFGSPRRFLTDLAKMLRYRATLTELEQAQDTGRDVKEPLRRFYRAAVEWQRTHGYQCTWWDPRVHTALGKLNDPALNEALTIRYEAQSPFERVSVYDQIRANFARLEEMTPRVLAALKKASE